MEHRVTKDKRVTGEPVRDMEYLLFKRRRFRASKACYPCKRRKVKCNLGEPCGTCTSRGHPDLCDYTAEFSSGKTETQSSQNHGQSSEASSPTSDQTAGLYVDPLIPYTSKLHLGSHSLPQLLSTYQQMNTCRPQHESTLSQNRTSFTPQTIFEVLCLQDSSTNFPFTNLWNPEDGPEKVYSALPEDEVIVSLIRFCQASIFRILPSIINFSKFETTLAIFLYERAKLPPDALPKHPPGCSPNLFGLLFSILACGLQLSSEDENDIMKARVFACCSFQCLRLGNFISFPTVEVVQTLIMLVNFLMNQADAGGSWSMLGLTIRLAQSLGLHCVSNPDMMENLQEKDDATVRYHIWRALIWQDTLVSLFFDRPSGISINDKPQSLTPHEYECGLLSFPDSCGHLFVTANRMSQAIHHAKYSGQQLPLQTALDFKDFLNQIESLSVPHIQDVAKCQTRDDYIQHYFFTIFSDSVMICLCRPAVLSLDEVYRREFADIHLSRSFSILNAYLELLSLDCPIRRSWIFVHITLSCALSLGMAIKDSNNSHDRVFLRRFVGTLSKTTICAHVPAYKNALDYLQRLVE